MKFILTFLVCAWTIATTASEVTPIAVADLTLKVDGASEEILYYGFAAGDELIFSFKELKNNDLKELEIIEYPSSSKFMDFKTKEIKEKRIRVSNTGIYKFVFRNSALTGRICKIQIYRVPGSVESIGFNTSVNWTTVYDTTYKTLQKKVLSSVDTIPVEVLNREFHVSSQTNMSNPPRAYIRFALPQGTDYWVYWVGVGRESSDSYKDLASHLPQAATLLGLTNPLIAFGLGIIPSLPMNNIGEDIDYYFTDQANAVLFMQAKQHNIYLFKKGNRVITDYARVNLKEVPLTELYMCFYNDNLALGVPVSVKIVAFDIRETYEDVPYQEMTVSSRELPVLAD